MGERRAYKAALARSVPTLFSTPERVKFSEDEARDDHGRWTTSGESPSGANPDDQKAWPKVGGEPVKMSVTENMSRPSWGKDQQTHWGKPGTRGYYPVYGGPRPMKYTSVVVAPLTKDYAGRMSYEVRSPAGRVLGTINPEWRSTASYNRAGTVRTSVGRGANDWQAVSATGRTGSTMPSKAEALGEMVNWGWGTEAG